jgi:RNA polymerase sigma-70 factor, ECF subfamily
MAMTDTPMTPSRRPPRRGRRPDGAEFEALFAAEYRPLVRIAYGLTGSVPEAEEIVQEAFLRCHQRWHRIAAYERPGAWLRRVVINLAVSRSRRVRSELRAVVRLGARPPVARADLGESQDFWETVRTLPARQRQAVVLFYGDDLPAADVADVMACADGTVRALLHQARQHLAATLHEEQPR